MKIKNFLALLGAIALVYVIGVIVAAIMSVIVYVAAGIVGAVLVLLVVGIRKVYKSVKKSSFI